MRVFVVGTGRCGTCTFYQACKPFRNYTVSHESKNRSDLVGNWNFTDNHIEIASNLTIGLPFLIEKYPSALWVRLKRNKEECVKSLVKEVPQAMKYFAWQWWYLSELDQLDLKQISSTFYDYCEELYKKFLPEDSLFYDIETLKITGMIFVIELMQM